MIGSVRMRTVLLELVFCRLVSKNDQVVPATGAQFQGRIAQNIRDIHELDDKLLIYFMNLIQNGLVRGASPAADKAYK